MTDQLYSQNLTPFKRRRNGYHLPGGGGDDEERLTSQVDDDLSIEEQRFIRHYLGYADMLLRNASQESSSWDEKRRRHACL